MRDVDVIVVHYKTQECTERAIASALPEECLRRVIVVDNHSGDGSCEHLQRRFAAAPVTFLPQNENLGFGTACNRGARLARGDFLFFLNSDALVQPSCLALLRAKLEQRPDIGLEAPDVYRADGETLQSDAQGIFPTAGRILARRTRTVLTTVEPDWVSAVAVMARRVEYLQLGGFSERLFLYYEDVDLCRRYRRSGKTVVREPAARVIHLGGQSLRSSRERKRLYYTSQDRYLELNGTPWVGRQLVKLLRLPYAKLRT